MTNAKLTEAQLVAFALRVLEDIESCSGFLSDCQALFLEIAADARERGLMHQAGGFLVRSGDVLAYREGAQ